MINCIYLNYNERVLLSTVANEKDEPSRTILINITGRVNNTYQQYLSQFPTMARKRCSEIKTTELDEKAALKHCYSSPTASFRYVRGKIFSSQSDQLKSCCPYCLIGEPDTLDHYIGQAMFPEYSVLVKNLIPCCNKCNKKKDENWRKNGLRRIIHFHNDRFLHHRFLHARLIYRRGQTTPTISYFLLKPVAMSNEDFRIAKLHFKDLNLIPRYNGRANALVSSEIAVLKSAILAGNPVAEIQRNLMVKAASTAPLFGVNYWVAVIYETLASNTRLINSL